MNNAGRQWLAGAGWWVLIGILSIFGIAGVALVPLHPDESMQIYASRDFDRLLAQGVGSLTTQPPYRVDSDDHLRILNGSIHRHLVGWFRRLAGLPPDLLPPAPGWDWRLDAGANITRGSLPPPEVLLVGRLASAAFIPMIALAAAAIGAATVGSRWTIAYLVLLMLNPVVLLNARRAMQEGSLIGLGLLAVWAGLAVGRGLAGGRDPRLWRWALLGLSCGLLVAAKHSGILFAVAAAGLVSAGWLFGPRRDTRMLLPAFVAAVTAVLIFFALQPALWSSPPERIKDLLALRSEMMSAQAQGLPLGAAGNMRLALIPFASPLQFHESIDVAGHPLFAGWSATYSASSLAGLPISGAMAWVFFILVVIGIWTSFRGFFAVGEAGFTQTAPFIWWIVIVSFLVFNPLPWQRYFLPLIPSALLLVVLGLKHAASLLSVVFALRQKSYPLG